MGLFSKHKPEASSAGSATLTQQAPAVIPDANVSLTKGQKVSLSKSSGDVFTLITMWRDKDFDLYALVEYADGHVEVVSCFGTVARPKDFSLRTKDGAIVHVSGDKAADDHGDDDNLEQEVMTVRLNSNIRSVVPVVYSAKNSGTGSFRRYRVSTFVLPGSFDEMPQHPVDGMVGVNALNASSDDYVYTYVPAVIHNGPNGAELEAVDLYSAPGNENRPTVRNGVVTMNNGEENASKPRPTH